MVIAWEMWKTRHERLRERALKELFPAMPDDERNELSSFLKEGRTYEDWLKSRQQSNGSDVSEK